MSISTHKTILLVLFSFLISLNSIVFAQSGKVKVPEVLATGQITDASGNVVGTFDKGGNVLSADGKVLGVYMSPSTMYAADKETRLAKTDASGSLYIIQEDGKMKPYKLDSPENGAKEHILKDKEGKVKGKVHRNFVDGGSAALYVLNMAHFVSAKTTANAKTNPAATPASSTSNTTKKESSVKKNKVKPTKKKSIDK